jgi:hypothetical protein
MFDSAIALERYRLGVIRRWPGSAVKDKLLASIECSLRRNGLSGGAGEKLGRIGENSQRVDRSGS